MDNVENTTHGRGEVKGLVLRVDGWSEQQPIALRFYKDRTESINIGRKSAQNAGKYVATDDRALFQCPVVSRQHATLTFTEQGDVTLTDLGSHHGTHLRKPSEVTNKSILPGVPQNLTAGDVITFGKSVVREETQVQPIVVRIDFEYNTPAAAPAAPTSQAAAPSERRSSTKPSSGRYGIYVSSSASESSSDESDSDSVVFLHTSSANAPLPANVPLPPPNRDINCLPSFQSLRSSNFSLPSSNSIFRHTLPPIHTLPSAPSSPSSSVMEISPIDEVAPAIEFNPVSQFLSDIIGSVRSGVPLEPQVIGAWPNTPIDLRSVSPPPFPRGTVDNSLASSEDGAASHVSSDVDVDEDVAQEQASAEDNKSAETSVTGETLPPAPEPIEIEASKDSTEDSAEKVAENDIDVPMSDVNDPPTEDAPTVEAAAVAEVSHEEPAPVIEEALPEPEKSNDDEDVESLKESVAAIAELRRKAEEDLAAIKAAHAEYEMTLAKMQSVPPTPTKTPSSKRKRTDELDENDASSLDVESSTVDLQLLPIVRAEVGQLVQVQAPPAKRRRVMRVMSAVAQTTAIATVGAVAAWSALAFS